MAADALKRVDSKAAISEGYSPDEDGYFLTLADGVPCQVRWAMLESGPEMQMRVPNRQFAMPAGNSLETASKRCLRAFGSPNRELVCTSKASARVRSLETLYQVKAAIASDDGSDDQAATWGIAPWMLG
eukprot:7270620-Karenia_brevis.AAC.1